MGYREMWRITCSEMKRNLKTKIYMNKWTTDLYVTRIFHVKNEFYILSFLLVKNFKPYDLFVGPLNGRGGVGSLTNKSRPYTES